MSNNTDEDAVRRRAREDFEDGIACTGMPAEYYFEYGRIYQQEQNLDARTKDEYSRV